MLYTQFVLFAMDADQESAAAAVVIGVLLKRRTSKQKKALGLGEALAKNEGVNWECIILSYKSYGSEGGIQAV